MIKASDIVRTMNVMASGLAGGTSFTEDYTYHIHPNGRLVLGSHMLEICPTIADGKASLKVHPLGIGAKIESGKASFKELEAYMLKQGDAKLNTSGRQEFLKNLINEFI